MKTLKLTMVVVLISCSVVLMARPTSSKKTTVEAKKELYKDVKSNLVKWNTMQSDIEGNEGLFVVHCQVNSDNQVEIMKIYGDKQDLKSRIIDTMAEHPVKANAVLQGEVIAFTLRFEKY